MEASLTSELQRLIDFEDDSHAVVLDLKEVQLVNQDTVRFLARCEANGVELEHCPAYIREWITREGKGE